MEKKIKDLTKEELEKICRKNINRLRIENCKNCIFYQQNICITRALKAIAGTNFLDREVDIPQPHILDKQEHDYLRAVIKPYKVKYIHKFETRSGNHFIQIVVVNSSVRCGLPAGLSIPYFTKDTMYKGMEANKKYTIEDLELDKEWEE